VEAIQERIAEITFSANLVREMCQFTRALAHARTGFALPGSLDRHLLNTRFHMIDTHGLTSLQGTSTKLLAHAPFMQRLMLQGQERAQQWLATDFDCVGKRTSVDLPKWFG
jgi:NTE family protein